VAGSVEEALRGLREEEGSRNKDAVMHSLCLFTVRVRRKSRLMLRGKVGTEAFRNAPVA
jgi:hypothetical protein